MTNFVKVRRGVVAAATALVFTSVTVPTAGAVATPCGDAPNGYNIIVSNDAEVIGTAGPDFICGGNADNRINGRGGDDLIFGKGGNDILIGGKGSDIINGGTGDDTLAGGPDADILNGDAGNDIIKGGGGDDELHGHEDNDFLSGRAGADVITGDSGDDELVGSAGHDTLSGGGGNDLVQGGKGRDTVLGGGGDDILKGASGGDFLNGGAGIDDVDGGTGSDSCIRFATEARCEATDIVVDTPQPPIPFDDTITVDENSVVTFDVTANDIDANGDALTVTNVSGPAVVGTFTDNGDNTITYSPVGAWDSLPLGASATELLSYDVSDGTSTVTANVLISVKGVNDLPVALDEKLTINGGASMSVDVLANDSDVDDGDVLAVTTAFADPEDYAGGDFEMVGSTITWTPSADYTPQNGDKIFINYTVVDGRGGHDTAALEFTIDTAAP